MDTDPELVTTLNEKLDRLSNSGHYSFSNVLDSIIDAFEMYKCCSDCDGEIEDEEEDEPDDVSSFDGEGDSSRALSSHNQGNLNNGYFEQLIEDAGKKCDGARSVAMSSRIEAPSNENIKDGILKWCKVYSLSHNNWSVGFEIELSGILPEDYRRRHGHVFQALGFSFATPVLIEAMFEPLDSSSKLSLETLLGAAFRGLSAMHGNIERKLVDGRVQEDQVQQTAKGIDASKPNPYGLRSLLPRMAKDFFSQQKRDPEDDNNELFTCEDNIFVRFLLFTGSRLVSLLKRCIVCDKELPFTVSRLSSCADELCLFGFEVLGLGAQVLQEVIRLPLELIDLEISLALAAVESSRDVFEPFPPFLLEKREILEPTLLLNNDHNANPKPRPVSRRQRSNEGDDQYKNKSIYVLWSIIKAFPPVSVMRLCTDEFHLKAELAKLWLLTPEGKSVETSGDLYFGNEVRLLPYNVLRFILCTNRLPLVLLSENNDKVLKVDTSDWGFYQFAVLHDSSEREALYTGSYRNEQDVSRFGFHGSPTENWYSIMRNGLRCFSNTKLMYSGNSLGDGIYLANRYEYSAEYTTSRSSWGPWRGGFHVVSICEVISSPTIEDSSEGIFMVPKEHEGSVAVRYLLIFKGDLELLRVSTDFLRANISDGHILSHRDCNVDLSQHYQSIRQKYASGASSQ